VGVIYRRKGLRPQKGKGGSFRASFVEDFAIESQRDKKGKSNGRSHKEVTIKKQEKRERPGEKRTYRKGHGQRGGKVRFVVADSYQYQRRTR